MRKITVLRRGRAKGLEARSFFVQPRFDKISLLFKLCIGQDNGSQFKKSRKK